MKQPLFVAAILAALATPCFAAEPAAVVGANPGGDVAVRFVDGPTGFNYVWLPDQGWKFVGRNPEAAAAAAPAASPEGYSAGAPLAEFVDATTGFRFVWRHGAGWEFAGKVAGREGDLAQLASLAGGAR